MELLKLLKASFNAAEAELTDDRILRSLPEWDSMAHMFFITRLEEEYGVELTGDEIADMQTVGAIKQILAGKGKSL